jgi:hypothetical protein
MKLLAFIIQEFIKKPLTYKNALRFTGTWEFLHWTKTFIIGVKKFKDLVDLFIETPCNCVIREINQTQVKGKVVPMLN